MSLTAWLVTFATWTSFLEGAAADYSSYNNSHEYMDGAYGPYPRQRFLSSDAIAPVPNIVVSPHDDVSSSSYVLWTPAGVPDVGARPMILDARDLSLVWYAPMMGPETLGATVQRCNDTDFITVWTRTGEPDWKAGAYYLLNEKYQVVHEITGHGSLTYADAHELTLTPNCTAIFTSYQNEPEDHDVNGVQTQFNLNAYFQEIDIATDRVLFQWSAVQHVNVSDSYWDPTIRDEGHAPEFGFDWFHINSVHKDAEGNYLVSSRHCHALYYVSGVDGEIIWQLGGKNNMFKDLSNGTATDFAWQHHARFIGDDHSRVSIFDNRNTQWHLNPRDPTARGLLLSLDYARMEASVAHEYMAPSAMISLREGSMQVLQDSPKPNNVLLGYGSESGFTEFSEDGTILWDVAFAPLDLNRYSPDNYRALKVNWTGNPFSMPDIAPGPPPEYEFDVVAQTFSVRLADRHGNALINDTVYFSWNGATEIKSWVVLASNETGVLDPAQDLWAEVPKSGFEQQVWVGAETNFVAVLALDGNDEVLGASQILEMRNGELHGGVEPQYDEAGEMYFDTSALTAAWQGGRPIEAESSIFGLGWPSGSASQVMVVLAAICGFCFSFVVVGSLWRGLRPKGYMAAGTDEGDEFGDQDACEIEDTDMCQLDGIERDSPDRYGHLPS